MKQTLSHQTWSAEVYATNADFVPALGRGVLDLLDARAGETILDLGCGDGKLTAEIAASGALVMGVDTAPDLLSAAMRRGLDVRHMDGQSLSFDRDFDAVFSNAAMHWMRDLDAVVAGVRAALRPGGRFVGEFGGHGNVAAIATALIAALERQGIDGRQRFPWVFPTVSQFSAILGAHGFAITSIVLVPRPTPLPTGMRGWLDTFANPFVHDLDDKTRRQVINDAITYLAPSLCDETGAWSADYVRLRFAAHA